MKSRDSLSKIKQVKQSIYHQLNDHSLIIRSAYIGGLVGAALTLMSIISIFSVLHLNGQTATISTVMYIVWLISGVILSFASGILGMLIGILCGEIQLRYHIWLENHKTLSQTFVGLKTRKGL